MGAALKVTCREDEDVAKRAADTHTRTHTHTHTHTHNFACLLDRQQASIAGDLPPVC